MVPQVPQLAESICVLRQAEPQSICPVGHTHAPPVHAAPAGHTVPHAPQLLVSRPVSTHTPAQRRWPAGQPLPGR
jgi:hypothetical protein